MYPIPFHSSAPMINRLEEKKKPLIVHFSPHLCPHHICPLHRSTLAHIVGAYYPDVWIFSTPLPQLVAFYLEFHHLKRLVN